MASEHRRRCHLQRCCERHIGEPDLHYDGVRKRLRIPRRLHKLVRHRDHGAGDVDGQYDAGRAGHQRCQRRFSAIQPRAVPDSFERCFWRLEPACSAPATSSWKDWAVCLFNGKTGALISTLTGGGNVGGGYTLTALTNGNFVVSGVGSATWGSGTTGVSGPVSAANSLVESGSTGPIAYNTTVVPLANGNYVVDFVGWHADTGAVAWGTGRRGPSALSPPPIAWSAAISATGWGVTAVRQGASRPCRTAITWWQVRSGTTTREL